MLPYTSWLDYCRVAYVISEQRARTHAAEMVQALLAVTPREAAAKLASLERMRDAFVFRDGSSADSPTAAEHILDEACSMASQLRGALQRNGTYHLARRFRMPPDLSGCTL